MLWPKNPTSATRTSRCQTPSIFWICKHPPVCRAACYSSSNSSGPDHVFSHIAPLQFELPVPCGFSAVSQTHFALKISWSGQTWNLQGRQILHLLQKVTLQSHELSFSDLCFSFLCVSDSSVPFLYLYDLMIVTFLMTSLVSYFFFSFLFFAFLFSSLLFLALCDDAKLSLTLGWISSETSTSYTETHFQTTMFWKPQHGFYPFIAMDS